MVFESVPTPNVPPASCDSARRERAVAEVRFGGRGEAHDGAGRGETACLGGEEMRRVDDAPACIDIGVVEQPLHRARAAPGDAVRDFAHLFRRVDVDRPARARQATTAASSSGVTARRLCGATPSAQPWPAAARRSASTSRAKLSIVLMKRRCPAIGAAPPKFECA